MSISPNTQAILLLTAPLINGHRSKDAPKTLSQGQYRKVAKFLHERALSPSDFLLQDSNSLVDECQSSIEIPPLFPLLGRGFQLSQALERWSQRSIWVLSRADADYPQRLRKRLGDLAPPVLYGCGNPDLLNRGGLAVVGSRNISDEIIRFTNDVGRLAANANLALISGGARGVDQAAMQGAGETGGYVVGILADNLERASLKHEHREALQNGSMVLCSPYDPKAGFIAGHAMQRNKFIYALSDAALVVNSDYKKGGTWTGAVEQLDKLKLVPIFVRTGSQPNQAMGSLLNRGASQWPCPRNAKELVSVIDSSKITMSNAPQRNLFDNPNNSSNNEQDRTTSNDIQSKPPKPSKSDPAQSLFMLAERLILEMEMPINEEAVSKQLDVSKTQARKWIISLCESEKLQKKTRPVRYTKIDS